MRILSSLHFLVAALALAACGGGPSNGYAVDLTITTDSTVTQSARASIGSLQVNVSGAEMFTMSVPVNGQLGSGSARIIYRPRVMGGTLDFSVVALDGSGMAVASGMTPGVVLSSGATVTATVLLSAGGPPLLDMTGAGADLTTGPADLTAGATDLTAGLADFTDVTLDLAVTADDAGSGADLTAITGDDSGVSNPDLSVDNSDDSGTALDLTGVTPPDLTAPPDFAPPPPDLSLLRDYASSPCSDGVKNGNETDVDCGGSCAPCANGKACLVKSDCASGACTPNASGALLCNAQPCGACQVALAAGTGCTNVVAGADPKGDCSVAAACKLNRCNGLGSCNAAAGTSCGAPACSMNTATAPTCDASGACQPNPHSCGNFTCTGTSCRTSCALDTDCASGSYCFRNNCLPRPFTAGANLSVAPAGSKPQFVAVGDFNNDGNADLAVANANGNSALFLGKGDGGFGTAMPFYAGASPSAFAVADFKLDGNLDLVPSEASETGRVLAGDGKGGFATVQSFGIDRSNWVVTGDFNRDGTPDLAFALAGTSRMEEFNLYNNGTLKNGAAISAVSTPPGSLAAADFNRDGKLDVVTAAGPLGHATLFLGNGDGTFAGGIQFGNAVTQRAIAAGDLNNDGKPDVVIASQQGGTFDTYLGNASGFSAMYSAGNTTPLSIALADFNGDGKLDAVGALVTDNLSLHLGNGDGRLQPAINLPLAGGAAPVHVGVGDFNNDGKPDLAVANSGNNTVSIYLNAYPSLTTLDFLPAKGYSAGASPIAVAAGDTNSIGGTNLGLPDGLPDVLVASQNDNLITYFLGSGGGALTRQTLAFPSLKTPQQIAVGDLDRDGRPDFAVSNGLGASVSVLLSGGPNQTATLPINPSGVAIGDINSDGAADLVTVGNFSGNLVLSLNSGTGTFNTNQQITTGLGNASSVALGDINGDGHLDVVVATDGKMALGLGDGKSFFNFTTYAAGGGERGIAIGDYSGDGKLDLAMADANTNTVSIFLNGGNGSFVGRKQYPAGQQPYWIAAADFNRDGKLDLAVAEGAFNGITVLLGVGNGTFQKPAEYLTADGKTAISLTVADLNDDARPDIVSAELNGGISVFLNNSH